ncbi:hypothetical protein D1872_328190 [compost metagenome]
MAGGAIAGDALGIGHPGDHTFPRNDQDPMGFGVDVADFAALAVEAYGVGFGGLVDTGDHSVYIGAEWENKQNRNTGRCLEPGK